MDRRRSRLEISLNVLSIIREGVDKPTRIMYAANMSWVPTQKILSSLGKQDLLKVEPIQGRGRSTRRYLITEKGITLLDYFDKAKEIVPLEVLNAGD